MKKIYLIIKEKFTTLFDQVEALVRISVNSKNDIGRVQTSLDKLNQQVNDKNKQEVAPSLVVARHILGSIDITDITDPDAEISDETYGEYVARAAQFYSMLEKEAKWMMKLQHDFWFTQASDHEQTMFGRGTFNGVDLFLERFKLLRDKHLERTKKPVEEPLGSREDILARLQVDRSDQPEVQEEQKG